MSSQENNRSISFTKSNLSKFDAAIKPVKRSTAMNKIIENLTKEEIKKLVFV